MIVRVIGRRRWQGTSRLPALYPALPEQADHEVACRRIASGLIAALSLVSEGRFY